MAKVDLIRPNRLKDEWEKAARADQAWIDLHRNEFIEGSCPLCGRQNSGAYKKIITKDKVVYADCPICGTLYQERHPDEDAYREYYSVSENLKFFSEKIFKESHDNRKKLIYKPRLKKVIDIARKYGSSDPGFYEIGAGSGQFAAMARDSGFFKKVVAIEPNPSLAEDCRALGLETWESTVERVDQSIDSTSVIASFECLEHLADPAKHISGISNILKENGLLIITTPNGRSLEVMELGENSTTLGFNHVHIFNPYSIKKLLEKNGFEVIEITTPGILDVDLVQRGMTYLQSFSPFLKNLLEQGSEKTLEEFQNFLVNNNYSSHMWAVARKI